MGIEMNPFKARDRVSFYNDGRRQIAEVIGVEGVFVSLLERPGRAVHYKQCRKIKKRERRPLRVLWAAGYPDEDGYQYLSHHKEDILINIAQKPGLSLVRFREWPE